MCDVAILFIHLIVTITHLFRLGGARATATESLLVKHRLLILNRSRERASAESAAKRSTYCWPLRELDMNRPQIARHHPRVFSDAAHPLVGTKEILLC